MNSTIVFTNRFIIANVLIIFIALENMYVKFVNGFILSTSKESIRFDGKMLLENIIVIHCITLYCMFIENGINEDKAILSHVSIMGIIVVV